jgi:site-specific DNA-cytosine methylase
MKVLELFCGTKSFTKVAEARGHECRTLDNDPKFEPTYCMDIMEFEPSLLGDWRPDVIWASPPCQCFSVMVISRNWESKSCSWPIPKRPETIRAMEIVKRTLTLVKELNPHYFFIENPRAMLRKMAFMQGLNRSFVTYCQYGLDYQKPTDIWNNCPTWKARSCKPGDSCHETAHRGAHAGLQGKGRSMDWTSQVARAIVPPRLCEEIIIACEKAIA